MLLLLPVLLGGCTYYEAAPGTYTTSRPANFERTWNAVLGAFDDQGVGITREDRAAGVIQGIRNGIRVTANVQTQADGSVRVSFKSSRETDQDPDLVNRIASAYDRRMGR
jgi:hypothetical protein